MRLKQEPMDDLVAKARAHGWAAAAFDPRGFERWLPRSHWTAISTRRGGPSVDTLRPTSRAEAHPRSLSALSGFGAQPLHTDGAHSRQPPDLLVLYAPQTSSISTVLWSTAHSGVPGTIRDDMQHGLFVVDPGESPFLAPAMDGGRLRFDPGCMAPADARARRVVEFFAERRPSAFEHEWSTPHLALIIDNNRTLHARNDATAEPGRVLHRISLRAQRNHHDAFLRP